MSVKVLAASSTTKLIARATVKTRLGITDASQDIVLGELIAEASSAIEEYVGRPLARQQYLETLTGNGRSRISLARLPVDRDSVTLTIDGTAYTDFTVEDWSAGFLWRDGGWYPNQVAQSPAERDEENIAVTYKAGYVLPEQIAAWATGTAAAGSWVRPTAPVKDLLMECTTGGTASGSEPTWPTTAGSTVSGGGLVVYTARHAQELPKQIVSAAWLTVHRLHGAMGYGSNVRAIEGDGQRIEFSQSQMDAGGLTEGVSRMLDGWRYGA